MNKVYLLPDKLPRIVALAVVIVINFVLQSTVFQYIEVLGVKPNTALVLICGYGVLRGDLEGAFFGFFAGLFQDVYYGTVIGFSAMLGMLTGFFCGKPLKDFYRENYFLPMLLVAASTFVYQFVYYISFFLFRGKVNFAFYLNTIIFPGVVYTTASSLPVYGVIYLVNKKLEAYEKKWGRL